MKCEICHKADAATVLHRKKPDGTEQELFVCKACATTAAEKPSHKEPVIGDGKKIAVSGDEQPPEFVENFFKAALGLVEGIAESEKGKKSCPGCGCTWEQIREKKRVGCPRCYRAFAELIRNEFLAGAYGRTHVGDMPGNITGRDTRAFLERELKAAVKSQRFEKAAEIRRKLDQLGGHGGKERP